ncbi:MG2 domain-containing protein [Nitrosopumilus ureiphilus]|uniref:LTD domain-containing protein n=1 Tax=Nitrosopumilus ureiphilus TaxID=1470067 RepID=A0A7D5M5A7_9ARCH|nr:MG2 domain-containing protein [Nitrosopumilus ureiphilus]QLH06431.1 hypothetical protein C5F50_04580 [Nitrosopumilus ureiphilus]
MNRNLSLVLSLVLLAGIIAPVYAQTNTNHVVINEVEINPPGNDASSVSEWIELYNPTESNVDLGGWKIASTTVLKKTMTIPAGTIIKPGQFLTYSYQSLWFTDSNESVELRDNTGVVIDKTPAIADINNDFKSWQRIYDGFDFDISSDWKFVTSTAGSSNGKLVETKKSDELTVTISSEKQSYLFGETAILKGNISKEVFITKPFFKPEQIVVNISGPNFSKIVTLYPDLNLNFKTTLNLQQVLGINQGSYDVSVSYAGATANTNFSVGSELIKQVEKEDGSITVLTDKSQYLPGQTVSISGLASKIIPFEGMKLTVKDSDGKVISGGTLYPTKDKFTTNVFLTTVNPSYGTYEINAEYSDKSASTTFEVIKDIKEDVPISLWTDKEVYGLGDIVNISGRLNQNWVGTLDLEIIQSKSLSLGTSSQSGGGSSFKILDSVKVDGDGKFKYSFTIPTSDSRLGNYWIKVAKDVGSATKFIKAVENPETYVASTDPLVVTTNKSNYDFSLDKKLIISGQIFTPKARTSFEVPTVKISILTEDGKPLQIIGSTDAGKLSTSGVSVGYDFTAIPESSGLFSTEIGLERLIFSEGKYLIKAQYEGRSSSTTFEISDLLNLGDTSINASLDKSVYGLGETIKLTGIYSAQTTDSQGVELTLHKPNGNIDKYGTNIDGGFFSWEWKTPVKQSVNLIGNERSKATSNLGIYRLNVATGDFNTDILFKVSLNPEDDELIVPPLFVSSSKSLYKAGEKLLVEGTVNKYSKGSDGAGTPQRVTIKIIDGTFPYAQIYESAVYPDQGGAFQSTFEMPVTIFSEGQYKVKAIYKGIQTENTFSVANDFTFGLDGPVALLISTDKSEYYPGDVVVISGKPNKLIYLEAFDVSVVKKTGSEITCGSFICGKNTGPVTTIRPSPSGSFSHQFVIPNSMSSIGLYQVTVDADFETKSIQFNVVEKPPTPKLDTVIEKENRISDKIISVLTEQKTVDDVLVSPRVLSGSLITPTRGDESSVNLKVSSASGICIIGQEPECLVSESTRKPGQIYDVVEVDGMSVNIRYSGSDVRLEKFSILPESSDAFLPDTNWNVEIIKDEQVSRFYYKVTYKALE